MDVFAGTFARDVFLQASNKNYRERRGEEHEHGGDDAYECEPADAVADRGEASQDGDACGNEEHGHVFQQEARNEFDFALVDHARDEQREQNAHTADVRRNLDGQMDRNCFADIANAGKESQLNEEKRKPFAVEFDALSHGWVISRVSGKGGRHRTPAWRCSWKCEKTSMAPWQHLHVLQRGPQKSNRTFDLRFAWVLRSCGMMILTNWAFLALAKRGSSPLRQAGDRGQRVRGKGSAMELAILLVALVVTLAVCFAALRLLAYEFDCVCGPSANGRQRAQRVHQELVDLS